MHDDVWVGIDLGTQGVRVLATTGDGRVVGRGDAALTSRREDDRHEQDAEQWWTAVGAASLAALRDIPRSAVQRVAVCATSGTLVLVNAQLRPLGPGLMYDDLRALEDGERLLAAVPEEVWRRLAVRPQPSWAVARLAWLARNLPGETRQGIVLHQADFVTSRLAGWLCPGDTSHALKSAADPLTASWPEEVVAAVGLPESALPDLVRPGTPVGEVCAEAAAATGLPTGTVIVAGMTDGCAAQLATGALAVGRWNSVLGTTLVLKGVTERRVHDPSGSAYSHLAPDGRWWLGGASSGGAGVLTEAFPAADLAAMDAAADLDEPASCVTYPLAGRGERFPFVVPQAERFTLGQPRDSLDHYAALLQGVAYLERLCVDHFAQLGATIKEPLRVTGGAARSARWTRLRADVLGLRVQVPAVTDPAFGMAILAAGSSHGLTEAATRMVHVAREFEPRPEVGARLADGYYKLVSALRARGWLPDCSVAGTGAK